MVSPAVEIVAAVIIGDCVITSGLDLVGRRIVDVRIRCVVVVVIDSPIAAVAVTIPAGVSAAIRGGVIGVVDLSQTITGLEGGPGQGE